MGLTTWKNAPSGSIRKTDVTIAKNYLSRSELAELNRIVSMYLDFAEDQAHRKQPMHMAGWVGKLDAFLQFNERNILTHAARSRTSSRRITPTPSSPATMTSADNWRLPIRPAISMRRSTR